jgi:hypothetical protein
MRWLVLAIVLQAVPAAAGDGYFLEESLGGTAYHGDLARFGTGAPRLQIGFNIRRDASTVELFGAFSVPELFYIDCYGAECDGMPPAGLGAIGADLRQRWQIGRSRWQRLGLWFNLHGGLRWYEGTGAIDGYRGPGIGGGAGAELDIWVIGYFVDFGIDAMRLHGGGDVLQASTPYVRFGAKLGWL